MFVALNFCPINYSLCGDPEVFEITSLRLMIQWLQTQTFFLPATFLAPDFFFSLFLSTISVLALTFSISIMFLLSISVSLSSVSLSVFLSFYNLLPLFYASVLFVSMLSFHILSISPPHPLLSLPLCHSLLLYLYSIVALFLA